MDYSYVCIDAPSVIKFINSFSVSRDSFQSGGGNSALDNAEQKLRNEAANSKVKELEVLHKFRVNNINQLQSKIDEVVNNYSAFKSGAISKSMKDFAEKYDTAVSNKDLTDAIIKDIEQRSQENNELSEALKDLTSEAAIQAIAEILSKAVTTSREGKGKQTRSFYLKEYAQQIGNYMKDKKQAAKFSQSYKKDLAMYFVFQGDDSKGSSTWNIRVELEKNPSSGNLSFYPYYNLSIEEQTQAKNDNVTWSNFVNNLSSVISDPGSTYIKRALSFYSPADFFCSDMNSVIGILGEVQGLAILLNLMPDNTNFMAVGNKLNELKENRPKLGADILLNEEFGIQVKNYKGFPLEGGSKGFWLQKDFTATEIINRLTNSAIKYDLGSYIAITQYNQPITQNKENTQFYDKESVDKYSEYYDSLLAKRGSVYTTIKALIAGDITQFWTFTEQYKILMEDVDKSLEGDYTNVFWFFGGEKLVASSQILTLLADRIKELKERLSGKDQAILNNFFTTYHYNDKLTWYPIDKRQEDGKTILVGPERSAQDILDKINVTLKLNIFLDDIKNIE